MFHLAKLKSRTPALQQLQRQLAQPESTSMVAMASKGIKAPNVNLSQTSDNVKKKQFYDVHAKASGRLGIMNMNKEHRFNTLSPGFAHEVSRGVSSLYEDRLTRAIFVQPDQGKHWSNGTDFRTMLSMKQEGNYQRLAEYLQQIYQLQTQIAKTNKPIIAVAPGHAFNSGATLLASCGFPMMTIDSKMAFNECTFGFVPHSGATYYLSRLPNEFGTFLALTGLPIHGTDAAKLKLVDSVLQTTKHVEESVADVVYSMGYNPSEMHEIIDTHESPLTGPMVRDTLRARNIKMRNQKNRALDEQIRGKAGIQSGRDRERRDRGFEEAWERIPSSVADAEGHYNQILRREQIKHQNEGVGYLEYGGGALSDDFLYQQIYAPTLGYIKSHIGHQYEADKTVAFQHMEMIGRCFYANSLDEIKHNLSLEGSSFAKKCLEAMERNSDLSMGLALKMLRKATSLDYASCLRMEVKVASRMIETDEFDIGVQQVLMNPKEKRGQKHPNAAGYPSQPSKSHDLESYFEGAPWASNISVGAMRHALLPTRHYYERFSDQVRLWINEESTHQDELRAGFDIEAKEALQEQGIDVRDKGLTMQSAREHLAAQLAQERREHVQYERMEQIMCDKKLRETYFNNINTEVEKMKSMTSADFQSKVDSCVTEVFENAYVNRLQTMYDQSKKSQALERRRMFIKLKRFLFRSRCITTAGESHEKQVERMENYAYKLPHLSENWEKSWRDVPHPLIEKSPLYHLSKAIGRVTYSPIELSQEYLTNPQLRDQLSMLTIDKNELLKIQDDIYQNPQKYEAIFTKQEPIDWGQDRHMWTPMRKDMPFQRLTEYQYWHSMINDGTDTVQNWPFYKEYMGYKEWFDQIEDKAVHTLKVAVAQLLENFDKEENALYDGSDLTKRGQLESLLTKIEGQEQSMSEQIQEKASTKKTKQSKVRKITSSKRDYDYINQLLDETVCEDPHLQPFLDPKEAEKHPIIAEMQGKARDELLKMLEIVLLDKYAEVNSAEDKAILKKRLATLMTPKGMDRDEIKHQQLQLIDSYLLSETGKATLKSAIELIKPMYFSYTDTLMTKAGQEILQKMSVDDTARNVIRYYQFLQLNPGIKERSPALQKYWNWSKVKENQETIQNTVPGQHPTFKRRNLMDSFGMMDEADFLAKEDIESQKQKIRQQMLAQNAAVSAFDANLEAMEKEYELEAVKDTMKFDDENAVQRLEHFWTPRELSELHFIDKQMNIADENLERMKYEIENHFTVFDWLKIYGECIIDNRLDMNEMLQSVSNEKGERFDKATEGKPQDEWQSLAQISKFLAGFKEAQVQYKPDYDSEMPEFLARESQTPGSASQASLWQLALQKKNEFIRSKNQRTKADRTTIIRDELADFNRLQNQNEKRGQVFKNLERIQETQSTGVKDLVREVLNQASQTYVNFEKLLDCIVAGEDASKGLSKMIEVERLISDVKANKSSTSIRDRILQSTIDVQSIEDSKVETERDSSLTQIEKAQILGLVDHVNDQMQYVSNQSRQQISIGQFITDHHFSSPQSYVDYSNGVLQKKLTKTLGEGMSQDQQTIDWDVNGVRTAPIDHTSAAFELQAVAQGSESASQVDQQVELMDQETGNVELRSIRDHAQIQTIKTAKRLTELPQDMEQYKNFYENQLLQALMKPGDPQSLQTEIIDDYTNLRFKACMLNQEFSEQVHGSENGHLFLKVLRERVVDELGLTAETQQEDMMFKKMYENQKEAIKYDMDSMYSMQDVNNTQAMGYDNLEKRSGSKDSGSTYQNSHSDVFDKLLADYYLSQRGEYAESNKLMKQLTDVFDEKMKNTQTKHSKELFIKKDLKQYKLEQDLERADSQMIHSTAAKKIFDLDVLTQQAVQKNKSGLSDSLRKLSITDTDHEDHWTTQVPEYFDMMDVRKAPEKYVADKLQLVVNEAFEVRRKLERNMSRRELVAFDKVLAKYLEPENLIARLEATIEDDYSLIFHGRQEIEQNRNLESSRKEQSAKEPNMQRRYNKSIKDDDALYKQMAYGAMVEQKYKKQMDTPDQLTFIDKEFQYSPYTFERWYLNQLELDAKAQPRSINQDDYVPKKFMKPKKADEPTYLNQAAREEKFFMDHKLFLENKKEQHDRTSLFYILEQFYEQSREKPDKLSVAQDHMKDYFSDPDNTFFFDKNKIQ